MEAIPVIAALIAFFLAWEYRRASRRLCSGERQLEEAWREALDAFLERIAVLREFSRVLAKEGLVPEGRKALEELVADATERELDVEAIHVLDEKIRTVLWRVFAALPRERPGELRRAQNRLAEAAEEYDIKRRRYNELVKAWNELLGRFPYRFIAARRKYKAYELLPIRSEWELS